jgi:hypothetical protein
MEGKPDRVMYSHIVVIDCGTIDYLSEERRVASLDNGIFVPSTANQLLSLPLIWFSMGASKMTVTAKATGPKALQ